MYKNAYISNTRRDMGKIGSYMEFALNSAPDQTIFLKISILRIFMILMVYHHKVGEH